MPIFCAKCLVCIASCNLHNIFGSIFYAQVTAEDPESQEIHLLAKKLSSQRRRVQERRPSEFASVIKSGIRVTRCGGVVVRE